MVWNPVVAGGIDFYPFLLEINAGFSAAQMDASGLVEDLECFVIRL